MSVGCGSALAKATVGWCRWLIGLWAMCGMLVLNRYWLSRLWLDCDWSRCGCSWRLCGKWFMSGLWLLVLVLMCLLLVMSFLCIDGMMLWWWWWFCGELERLRDSVSFKIIFWRWLLCRRFLFFANATLIVNLRICFIYLKGTNYF